jgi:hypothetical protein
MNGELRDLVERNRIMDVINALFVGTDLKDWEAVKACLAPQVQFDMTSVAGGEPATLTPTEIVAGWEAGLKDIAAIHHQAGNYSVSVRGSEADAFCYGVAWHYLPNPSGRNTRTFVGSYDFHLVMKDDAWLIDLFRFRLKFVDGNAELK